MDYRTFIQKIIYTIIHPLIKGMIHIGVTPNVITALGLAGNIIATALFIEAAFQCTHGFTGSAFTLIAWAGGVILFAGLFDMMDGRLARMGNMTSTFGALWDSTLDRYSELITLFGICVIFIKAGNMTIGIITFLAMVGSVMVSYVRARAEGLGIECKVGFMQRPERVVVTALTAIISGLTCDETWLAGGMVLIAVLANITAFWRIAHCYKQLSKRDDKRE